MQYCNIDVCMLLFNCTNINKCETVSCLCSSCSCMIFFFFCIEMMNKSSLSSLRKKMVPPFMFKEDRKNKLSKNSETRTSNCIYNTVKFKG